MLPALVLLAASSPVHHHSCNAFHGDQLRSRPMATLINEEEPDVLWFFTGIDSEKSQEILADSHVNVAYSDASSNKFVSVSGRAQVIRDPEKAKKLWTPFAKGWFEGPDDPSLAIIRVDMDGAEYWEGPSKVVYLFNLVVSAVSGREIGMGENETVKLDG